MKTIYTLLGALLLICATYSTSLAQLSTPDGDSIISIVALRVNGIAAHVALSEQGWYIARDGHAPDVLHHPAFTPYILYPRHGHPDQFIQMWIGGRYKIMEVQNNAGILRAVEIWSDSIYVPGMSSAGMARFYADDNMHATIYSSNGVYTLLTQRKLSSPNWELDTLGLGRIDGYMVGDMANNFYLSSGAQFYVKLAGANNYVSRTVPFYGGPIVVDRANRIYRGGNNIYRSDDAGATWDSIAPDPYGLDMIDKSGRFYAANGSYINLSEDSGATWSQIGHDIIIHSTDSLSGYNILALTGDSILYAATRWGVFTSADHGTTWQQGHVGTGSSPRGYWRYADGREVVSSQRGIYVRNSTNDIWAKSYPSDTLIYNKVGVIQSDTSGTLYALSKWNNAAPILPMISTDRGTTWALDTIGWMSFLDYPGFGTGEQYYITENGTALINKRNIYKRRPGGQYVIDTVGLIKNGYYSVMYGSSGFASDYSGQYFCGIDNAPGAPAHCVWHRPANGYNWTYDSISVGNTLFGTVRFKCFSSDHAGSVIACDDQTIYYRSNNAWVTLPLAANEFCNAVGGDGSDAIFSAYYRDHYDGLHRYVGMGVYCTHDLGTTWSKVQGLDSVYVKAFQTIDDTTYVIGNTGLYKMTCNGQIVINGTSEVKSAAFDLFPNPASSACTITTNQPLQANTQLSIVDVTGKVVRNIEVNSSKLTFRTDDLAPGIYLCTLISDSGVTSQRKLVINN